MGGLEEATPHPAGTLEGYGTASAGVKEGQNAPALPQLEFLSQMLKHDVADEGGDERDNEVRHGQDVVECVSQRFSLTVGDGEFAHEKVGIEEKNDECDFDDGSPDGAARPGSISVVVHGRIITRFWRVSIEPGLNQTAS